MSSKTRSRRGRLRGENAEPAYVPRIALRSIDGHVTRTGSSVYAWYRLSPQRWSFRSDSQREDVLTAVAGQYGELQGRWLHLRVTSRPYPSDQWARAHTHNARNRLPDVPGERSFDDYMVGEQLQLHGRSLPEKEVYLGIEVRNRTLIHRASDLAMPVLSKVFPDAVDAELRSIEDEVQALTQIVSRPGLDARPVTAEEMWWLVHRSCTLGLPPPQQVPGVGDGLWATEDLAAFDDAADWSLGPYDPTVCVRGRGGSHAGVTREVCVLTVGLMQRLTIPQVDDPWVQHADRIGAVEWSARIYVRRPEDVQNELQREMGKVRSQVGHYTQEHGIDPPQALSRQAQRALAIDDEMSTGFSDANTRVRSWWRLAVAAETRREALQLAQRLVDLYKPKIAIEHPEAQHAMAREFIPGEPLASTAYLRRAPLSWVAAAMPHATADVGDRRGILLGETCTATRRPVAWDPWMAQEVRDQSGLTALVAGLGGGKSFLGGGIVYKSLRAGARWTVLDPSGPLAALCRLPELAPYARVIDLLNAQPGILNPYQVVSDPTKEDYLGEPDGMKQYVRALNAAQAARRELVRDVLLGLLPDKLAQLPSTQNVMLGAVRAVGGHQNAHPGLVLEALRKDSSEEARSIHAHLDELRAQMSLLIPEPGEDPYAVGRDDRLTVLTMAGLTVPKDTSGTARESWTGQERLGMALLTLAGWLTQRMVYEGPERSQDPRRAQEWRNTRKGVWIDEAFFLSSTSVGRVLMNRFARDSRKWNVRVLLASQLPADFLRIDGFPSLVDSVFVGRLDDEQAQADALRLLKVPVGIGYEPTLGQLSRRPSDLAEGQRDTTPRQFIFHDGTGGVERILVNFNGEHLQSLRQALFTAPGHRDLSAGEAAPPPSGATAEGAAPAEQTAVLPAFPSETGHAGEGEGDRDEDTPGQVAAVAAGPHDNGQRRS